VASLARADAALAAGDEAGVRAGLALAGKVFSYSAGQPPVMDDESVLAEWALLRFAQWEMAHRGGDPARVRIWRHSRSCATRLAPERTPPGGGSC
jgi:hypothetical protein